MKSRELAGVAQAHDRDCDRLSIPARLGRVKTFLDEDLPHKLRVNLSRMKFSLCIHGRRPEKGEVLAAAEGASFDVLVTGDQSMRREQSCLAENSRL